MGNPKQKWTAEQEDALRAGVAKHGTGKWKDIQRDREFIAYLSSRSNIDLKVKWRNMVGGGSSQCERDKSRTRRIVKPKPNQDVFLASVQTSSVAYVYVEDTGNAAQDGTSKSLDDGISTAKYNTMILEALAALKDPNGSDLGAIFNYIKQRHEVPQSLRSLSSRLGRLFHQGSVTKGKNGYKLKGNNRTTPAMKTPTIITEKDIRPRHLLQKTAPTTITSDETIKDATAAAAEIAVAEYNVFMAAEAVKEAERLSKAAEEAGSMLHFAKEILDRCLGGELVFVA